MGFRNRRRSFSRANPAILPCKDFKADKRLNKSLGSIAENIQAYVDVVMSEEEEAEEAAEKNSAEREQARGQRQEAEPYQQIAQEQKRMEDEQLFNSVLQEYFS